MNSTTETDSGASTVSMDGGKVKSTKKNVTAKKNKKSGNKVLAAWRDHVKVVASEEGMSYGKEAMQKAKSGKYGKQWAQIKNSIKGGAGPNGTPTAAAESEPVEVPEPVADSELAADSEPAANSEPAADSATMQEPEAMQDSEAQELGPEDNDLVVANDTAQPVTAYGGRKRKTTKKQKGKKSRKSRKHRRSRKH
jgi:hypothetical protein